MIFDADILGYFMNGGDNKEAGNIAYSAFAANPEGHGADAQRLDLVARHEQLRQAEGRRLDFMQWASGTEHDLFGARKMDFVNPVAPVGLGRSGLPVRGSPRAIPAISTSSRPRRRARRSTSRRSRCSST